MEVRENEIVKALEYCLAQGITSECERCRDKIGCRDTLLRDALDLINSQKAEKKELEFEFIRSRNELKGWKIRAEAYEEKGSKLQRKNSELEIELKAMRDAENSYKAEIERLQKSYTLPKSGFFNLLCGALIYTETLEEYNQFRRTIKSEAYKEFAERLIAKAEIVAGGDYGFTYEIREDDIDKLLAEMESERG